MSLSLFIPSIEEVLSLLIKSHASNGGTVLLSRANKIWNNPSTKSILNAWNPKDIPGRLLQTSLLELCGNGDGNKAIVMFVCSMLKELIRDEERSHPYLTNSIQKELPSLLSQIKPYETSPEDLIDIGLQSGLELEVVKKISEALTLSGASSAHISLEKGDGVGCEVIESDSLVSSLKVHNQKEVYLKGAMFALFSEPVSKIEQVIEPMEMMGSFENRPLVIVAPMVGGQALATINLNRAKGVVECYACDAPRVIWGAGWMEDLASFTGATVFNKNYYSKYQVEFFGSASEVVLNNNEMIVTPYEDHAERTSLRADELLKEAESCPHFHSQDLLKKRANALMGTLIRLKVGGVTESDARFRRVLVEKSLISMSDATRNGCVRGLVPVMYNLETSNPILSKSLRYPFTVICKNLNLPYREVLELPVLYEPFPAGRIRELITKAISITITLGSVQCFIGVKK